MSEEPDMTVAPPSPAGAPDAASSAPPTVATLPLEPRPLGEDLLDEVPPVEPQRQPLEPDAADPGPWLVIVHPQRIFAEAGSAWASPLWSDAARNILRLAPAFEGRTVITRWVPPADAERRGSWAEHLAAWPFADLRQDDEMFEIVPELRQIRGHVITGHTFGAWREELQVWLGREPRILLAGATTECGVLATALPAADDGATITVVTDACAGTSAEGQAAALAVLDRHAPRISQATTDEVVAGW